LKKKILILGCSGYVGQNLSFHFRNEFPNLTLWGVCRKSFFNSNFDKIKLCDLKEKKRLEKIVFDLNPNVIIYLVSVKKGSMQEILINNNLPLINLFQILMKIKKNSPQCIIVGSASEFGKNEKKNNEFNEQFIPISDYGIAKTLNYKLFKLFSLKKKLKLVYSRFYNFIGPNMPTKTFPRDCYEKLLLIKKKKSNYISFYNIKEYLDFIDIRDACLGIVQIIKKNIKNKVLNISYGKSVQLREIFKIMKTQMHLDKIKIKKIKNNSNPINSFSSNKYTKKLLNWKPKIKIEDSINDLRSSIK